MNAQAGGFRSQFHPWDDPSETPMIEFRNVTKRYGSVTAVDQVSLGIYEREFFALLGPSGCGKTTLMRMLAGFEAISEGEILLDGKSLADVPPYRRPVNMMFQSYALFPHMSVEKNIAFGLKQEGMPKSEIADRVGEMVDLVKLNGLEKRRPDQLSGGQKQRVALARSLAKQPRVLLLDEPLGALDRKLREETQFELVDLQERLGITFMIVTHDQEEAMTVADRIAVMSAGSLAQVSTPVEIYERPTSRYVADFLGDINILEGVSSDTPKKGRLEFETGTGDKLLVEQTNDVPANPLFAIRPEKLTLHRDEPKDKTNCLAGTIWDIAYFGDMTRFRVKLDNGAFFKVSSLNRSTEEEPPTWEDRVWLSFRPDAGMIIQG